MTSKKLLTAALAALVALMIIPQTGCSIKPEPVSKEGFCLDTFCTLTVYRMEDMSEERALAVIDGAYELCGEYEALLSKTIEGSDIWNVNHAAGAPVECDPATIDVIERGIAYGDLSGGKFDITIGKVTDLWDFHAIEPKVPDRAAVEEALTHVDYKQVQVEGNTVTMADPEGEIDLGGIAKGWIADRLAEYMAEQGVTGAVIDLGGNLSIVGEKAEGQPIVAGIRKPYTQTGEIVGSIPVSDASLVTSGVYERYFEEDGVRYHHILDPATGFPVENGLVSVTIVGGGDDGADCDALATICLLLGQEEGLKLIESMEGFEALFIDEAGTLTPTSGLTGFKAA